MDEIVSVHVAKTHLSRLLARVEAGEVITITRGRPRWPNWFRSPRRPNANSAQCAEKSPLVLSFSSPYRRTSSMAGINNRCDCFSIPMR